MATSRPFDGTFRVYDIWIDAKEVLEKAGYRLPALYDGPRPEHERGREHHKGTKRSFLLDVTRISDNRQLVAKQVLRHEVTIARFLARLPPDTKNHCVPLEDVLEYDGYFYIIIMPLLLPLGVPAFDTVGELLECIRQILEGIQFMHKYRCAHGDAKFENFMMSSAEMYPNGFMPTRINRTRTGRLGNRPRSTRTRSWPRYYVIDFEYAWRCDLEEEGPAFNPETDPSRTPGQNPFPNDIHFLGALIKDRILEHHNFMPGPLECLWPLALDMLHEIPSHRPTIDEVVWRFEKIVHGLTPGQLWQRVHRHTRGALLAASLRHAYLRLKYTALKVPPFPADIPAAIGCIRPSLKAFYTDPLHGDEDDAVEFPKRKLFRELYRTPAHLRDPEEIDKVQPPRPRRMPYEELAAMAAKANAELELEQARLKLLDAQDALNGTVDEDPVDLPPPVPPKP